jgi:hypothetical protein
MKEKPAKNNSKSREEALVERLRLHPVLMERFEAILGIAEGDDNAPIPKADDVEDMLIEEVRKLGNATMRNWAHKIEERGAREFLQAHPKGRCAKKKP